MGHIFKQQYVLFRLVKHHAYKYIALIKHLIVKHSNMTISHLDVGEFRLTVLHEYMRASICLCNDYVYLQGFDNTII